MRYHEEKPLSQDARDMLEFLGWVAAYLFVGAGFTMPLWGSLLGLF